MNYEEIRKIREEHLRELKRIDKPYQVEIRGIQLIVFPNVFPPTTDTKLIADHIKVSKGDRILDLTTGCGVLSVIAGLQGATGIAVDINPDAVRNANENFKRFGLNIKAIQSNLFQNVPDEQFDYIFHNGPYTEGEVTEPLEYSFFGAKRHIDEIFGKSRQYLKNNGKLLMAFAEWGELEYFEKTFKEKGYQSKILETRMSSDGKRRYRVYEFTMSLY